MVAPVVPGVVLLRVVLAVLQNAIVSRRLGSRKPVKKLLEDI
jgi:hypothetical protein